MIRGIAANAKYLITFMRMCADIKESFQVLFKGNWDNMAKNMNCPATFSEVCPFSKLK